MAVQATITAHAMQLDLRQLALGASAVCFALLALATLLRRLRAALERRRGGTPTMAVARPAPAASVRVAPESEKSAPERSDRAQAEHAAALERTKERLAERDREVASLLQRIAELERARDEGAARADERRVSDAELERARKEAAEWEQRHRGMQSLYKKAEGELEALRAGRRGERADGEADPDVDATRQDHGELDAVRGELARKERRLEELEAQRTSRPSEPAASDTGRVPELERRLAESEREHTEALEALRAELARAEERGRSLPFGAGAADTDALERELRETRERCERLEGELCAAREEAVAADARERELDAERAEASSELDRQRDAAARARRALHEREAALARTREELEQARRELPELEERVAGLVGERDAARTIAAERELEIEALRAETEGLRSELEERSSADAGERIADLKAVLARHRAEMRGLELQVERVDAELGRARAKRAEADERVEAVRDHVLRLEREALVHREEAAALRALLREAEEERERLEKSARAPAAKQRDHPMDDAPLKRAS